MHVSPGGTVNVTNNGSVQHSFTGNGFDSGHLNPGGTYSHTFTAPGTYAFHCTIHASMTGSVTVG